MYFFDPQLGERRRATMSDQWTAFQNDMAELWSAGTEDLQNRARGFQHEVRSKLTGQTYSNGNGRGMNGMMNTATTWSPGIRLIALGGGGVTTLYGLLRGGLTGKLVILAGLNLLSRGMFNRGLMSLFTPTAHGGISLQKDLHINAPIEEVFDFWRNYDNFPRFMSHLEEVREAGESRSHWVAKGPADMKVEWDATITQMQPNRVIAWESVPGSEVYNAGRVRFTRAGEGTHLSIQMTYSPPGGALGHAAATLFGADAKTALDEDLGKLKSLLEQGPSSSKGRSTGKTSGAKTDGTQSSGGQSSSTGQSSGSRSSAGQSNSAQSGKPGSSNRSGALGPAGGTQTSSASMSSERGAAGYDDSGSSELSIEPAEMPEEKKPGSSGSSRSGKSGGSSSSGSRSGSGK
jgi:uncharacterized membrane protein